MMFFVLALIVGTSTVFAQELSPGTNTARTLENCEDWPLHPRAGIPYIYEVDVDETADGGAATSYTWWATKDQNFIQTLTGVTSTNIADSLGRLPNGELLDYSSNYGQTTAAGNTVEITWSPEILAGTTYQGDGVDPNGTPTFVVALIEGECTNNIQVYELNPTPSFTLDIASIDEDGNVLDFEVPAAQCVDEVRGATYNAGVLDMDYGTDTIYFEVLAANFVTSWTPTFEIISGLTSTQTAVIGWATSLANAEAGTFIDGEQDIAIGTSLTGSTALTSSIPNTSEGVALYVRVVISNNTYESLDDQDFVLAVDGEDSTGQWDIDQNDTDCNSDILADQTDQATHTITARPTIDHATDDDDVVVPNDFIEKPE